MASFRRGRGAALRLAAALGAAWLAAAVGGTPAGAAPRTGVHPRVVLDGQTQWVLPSSPAAVAPFVLDLAARTAPAGAEVSATLYSRLRTRYDFETWVRNGPRGYPLARTGARALASLPPDPRNAGGSVLTLGVVQGATPGSGTRVGLGCAPPTGTGTCTGVYPVEVQLASSSGTVLDRFTTFLTYQAAKSVHPLELALLVRFAAPVAVTPHPSGADTIAPLPAEQAAALDGLVAALRAEPAVPVTLDPSPATLLSLDAGGGAGRAAVGGLATMSSDQSATEVLPAPFVGVNLGALAAAGEPTEITAQMAAGGTVLHRLHIATTGTPLTWVVTGPTGRDLAGGLTGVRAQQVVVPGSDLSPTVTTATFPTVGSYAGTWTSSFELSLGKGTGRPFHAALSDTFLSGQFAHVSHDPALAASQVLADLAMVHFERPNTTSVRGLVATTPDAALTNPQFYRVLLAGLQHDPDVVPVTLSQYFASVTVKGRRTLSASAEGQALRPSLADALSAARVKLSEFDGAVDGRPAILAVLDHDLLASESNDLSAREQAAAVGTFRRALSEQLRLVNFGNGGTFTLTASTGWIPVTVNSRAPYTVVGTLTVTGNKFIFPHSNSHPGMSLDHPTNLWRVQVRVRTSGDLPLHAIFTSPDGRLVIAQGVLTVRSTATSVVGIVLSAFALAILLAWWARTWWSGRRRKRLAGADETP